MLDSALALVKESGLAGLTIEGVAARAGVGKQTIYRWWPSKGAVAIDALLRAARPDITLVDSGDLQGDLSAVLDQVRLLLAEPELGPHFVACLVESQRDPALAQRFSDVVFGPVRKGYRQRLEQARHAGVLRSDVAVDDVLDMAFGALWLRAMTQPARLADLSGDRITQILLRGATVADVH